jgi:hypothetical protein
MQIVNLQFAFCILPLHLHPNPQPLSPAGRGEHRELTSPAKQRIQDDF